MIQSFQSISILIADDDDDVVASIDGDAGFFDRFNGCASSSSSSSLILLV